MAEKPILFSPWSVQRIRAKAKTHTRRIMKPQPYSNCVGMRPLDGGWVQRLTSADGEFDLTSTVERIKSPYQVTDQLWIREAWAVHRNYDALKGSQIHSSPEMASLSYKADGPYYDYIGRPRHARFMPKWASRLWLEVLEVRAQRVQDISEDDAIAEGIEVIWDERNQRSIYGAPGCARSTCPIEAFCWLWDSVNGEGAWERNEFVWAYTFREVNGG